MSKFIFVFIQFALLSIIAMAALFAVINVKQYAFDQNWINNSSLGLDGVIVWFCLMMGLFVPIKRMFNRLFRKHSIVKYM